MSYSQGIRYYLVFAQLPSLDGCDCAEKPNPDSPLIPVELHPGDGRPKRMLCLRGKLNVRSFPSVLFYRFGH